MIMMDWSVWQLTLTEVYCEIEDMRTKIFHIMQKFLECLKARYCEGLCEALRGFSDNYIREMVCLSSFLF
jgi:hypothetical protein